MAKPEPPDYWTGAHTLHRLRYHLVFVPKYRKRVLTGAVAARLKEMFEQVCEINRWQMHELSIQPDHVHLLLQIPPHESLSKVVQRLKGRTSKVLRSEYPELEEFLWGDSFWGDGFFAESMGQIEESVIRRYIRDQGQQSFSFGLGKGRKNRER